MDTLTGILTFGNFMAVVAGFFFRHWQAILIGSVALGAVRGAVDIWAQRTPSSKPNLRQ
jgi:hypothetical protein